MSSTTATCQYVKDIMTSNPVRVTRDTRAQELAHLLERNEISGVPVVDGLDRVVGVVSRTDLLHRCVAGPVGSRPGTFFASLAEGLARETDLDPEELGTVEEFMSPDPETVTPDEPLGVAARHMVQARVHRLVVVDDQQHVLGIVTSLDLLKALQA